MPTDSKFDNQLTITKWESKTVQAAVKGLILNIVTILMLITGKAIDAQVVQQFVDSFFIVVPNLVSIYYYWKAYKGRIDATQTIEKK